MHNLTCNGTTMHYPCATQACTTPVQEYHYMAPRAVTLATAAGPYVQPQDVIAVVAPGSWTRRSVIVRLRFPIPCDIGNKFDKTGARAIGKAVAGAALQVVFELNQPTTDRFHRWRTTG